MACLRGTHKIFLEYDPASKNLRRGLYQIIKRGVPMLTPSELSARVKVINRDMRQIFVLSGSAWASIIAITLI